MGGPIGLLSKGIKEMVNALEKLAREATPGPWQAGPRFFGTCKGGESEILGSGEANDIAFVSAANPETILKLIAVVKAAQGLIPDCQSFHHSKKNQHTYLDRCPLVDEFNKALAALEKPDGE